MLISALNESDGRWILKARVSSVSSRRSWANGRSEGTYFSITLTDEEDSTIRGTFFREAVDKFYHLLRVGNIYKFSGGRLQRADPKYNTTQSSLEIIFDVSSEIILDHSPSQTSSTATGSVSPKQRSNATNSSSSSVTPKGARHTSTKWTPNKTPTNEQTGAVINPGVWGRESSAKRTTGGQDRSCSTATEVTPVFDSKLTDADCQKLRADRAAAAEARMKKETKGFKKRSRSKSPVRLTPTRKMRWTL